MSISSLVTLQHLNPQSDNPTFVSLPPHQLISNQESLRLQYALRQRAIELGWSDNNIEVIDTDLGITAASAEQRPGFKELLAQVTLGLVGCILSYDVTRLSRNCSDWYPLLDLCGLQRLFDC
ncbi:recombinase family protein [Fischerella sp. PCC 9605]|uniref:recombinase family protein n=1 Tax=Fischerella sp. PCC 9605 TaxID=1173024 RepID=UPI000479FE34|nr:recombinase family protein [Fischerella sp. PCC 9605]